MGEGDIFPHVGRDCRLQIEGARGDVYPIVTGTFGGVDFLHSVVGEGESACRGPNGLFLHAYARPQCRTR